VLTPEGAIYDKTGAGVLEHIQSFIQTYAIPLEELLVQDLSQYSVSLCPGD
jgi:phosphatidylserine decarboxylase